METATTMATPAEPSRPKRRLIPIIDPRFQWKYTLWVTSFGVVLTAVLGFLLYGAHTDNTRLLDLIGNEALREQVAKGDQIFFAYLVGFVLVLALGLGLWGLIVTHRISGPLYLVARHLQALASGQYPDIRPLRKHDELKDFFSVFGEAITSLRNRDLNTLSDLDTVLDAIQKRAADDKILLDKAVQVLKRQRESLTSALTTRSSTNKG